MVYYKIKNLTGNLPKRHVNKDTILKIEYVDNFIKKQHLLAVGETLYISGNSLPVSLHKMRMKGFISVVEITKNDFLKLHNPITVAEAVKPVEVVTPILETELDSTKKKVIKKVE